MFQNLVTSNEYPQIKNDQTTIYRTVLQIKALDAAWAIKSKDVDNAVYMVSNATGTWNFYFQADAPDAKALWDYGFGPDEDTTHGAIYVDQTITQSGQIAEWNGADTNLDMGGTDSPPIQSGCWDNTNHFIDAYYSPTHNWEDVGQGASLALGEWWTWEFWFKATDNFVVDETPEIKFLGDGGGGGVDLVGLRWTYKIITGESSSSTSQTKSSSSVSQSVSITKSSQSVTSSSVSVTQSSSISISQTKSSLSLSVTKSSESSLSKSITKSSGSISVSKTSSSSSSLSFTKSSQSLSITKSSVSISVTKSSESSESSLSVSQTKSSQSVSITKSSISVSITKSSQSSQKL